MFQVFSEKEPSLRFVWSAASFICRMSFDLFSTAAKAFRRCDCKFKIGALRILPDELAECHLTFSDYILLNLRIYYCAELLRRKYCNVLLCHLHYKIDSLVSGNFNQPKPASQLVASLLSDVVILHFLFVIVDGNFHCNLYL